MNTPSPIAFSILVLIFDAFFETITCMKCAGPSCELEPKRYIWEGSCGKAWQSRVHWVSRSHDVNQNGIRDALEDYVHPGPEDISLSMPWIIIIETPLGEFVRVAVLIRAKPGSNHSDIAITSAETCLFMETYGTFEHFAVFGVYNLQNGGQLRVPIAGCVPHGEYSPSYFRLAPWHNIGIITLKTAVEFSHTIKPICMPDATEMNKIGTQGLVVAWDSGSPEMRTIDVEIIDRDKCNKELSPRHHSDVFCIEQNDTTGYTKYETGGPIIAERNQRATILGVATLSRKKMTSAVPSPNAVLSVSYYIRSGWLEKQIRNSSALWKGSSK